MNLKNYLDKRRMTKYHLSKISGVPKETIISICAGRLRIEECSDEVVQRLANALECTVEYVLRPE